MHLETVKEPQLRQQMLGKVEVTQHRSMHITKQYRIEHKLGPNGQVLPEISRIN